mmetsp:Transcript_100040/g.198449  ORF Transcript_100040/g.198449 Transcript_100040/m.198449 type:complete len:82 (-) Transcript_100040:542-787(-)
MVYCLKAKLEASCHEPQPEEVVSTHVPHEQLPTDIRTVCSFPVARARALLLESLSPANLIVIKNYRPCAGCGGMHQNISET